MAWNKYQQQKRQVSTDGGITWADVIPYQYRAGDLIEANSPDCTPENPDCPIQYRWIDIDSSVETMCFNGDEYTVQKQQYSLDCGVTWIFAGQTRTNQLLQPNSSCCDGNEYICGDKISVEYINNIPHITIDAGDSFIPGAQNSSSYPQATTYGYIPLMFIGDFENHLDTGGTLTFGWKFKEVPQKYVVRLNTYYYPDSFGNSRVAEGGGFGNITRNFTYSINDYEMYNFTFDTYNSTDTSPYNTETFPLPKFQANNGFGASNFYAINIKNSNKTVIYFAIGENNAIQYPFYPSESEDGNWTINGYQYTKRYICRFFALNPYLPNGTSYALDGEDVGDGKWNDNIMDMLPIVVSDRQIHNYERTYTFTANNSNTITLYNDLVIRKGDSYYVWNLVQNKWQPADNRVFDNYFYHYTGASGVPSYLEPHMSFKHTF